MTRIEVEGAEGGAYIERRDTGRRVAIVCQDTWGKRHFYRDRLQRLRNHSQDHGAS